MSKMRTNVWLTIIAFLVAAACARPSQESANDTVPVASKGVAVFSFVAMNPESEAAASELTATLIQSLERSPNISVLTKSDLPSGMDDPSSHDRWPESELVSLILEGSVRKIDSGIAVTVQLLDTSSDEHVWSDTYFSEQLETPTIISAIEQQVLPAASR
jgi:adenylate cyclase